MEHIYGIVMFTLWPIVIYISYKMSVRNVFKYEEKLND